jgi:hypothetical protein
VPLDRSRSADALRYKNGPPSGERTATAAAAGRHQTVAVFHGKNRPHDQEETELKSHCPPKERNFSDYKFQLLTAFFNRHLG